MIRSAALPVASPTSVSAISHGLRRELPPAPPHQAGEPVDIEPSAVLRIGFLQFAPQLRSESENVDFVRSAVREITDAVVVLPEFFLGSYRTLPAAFPTEAELAVLLEPLIAVGARQRLRFVGSLPVHCSGRSFNRALVIGANGLTAVHDKVRLFGAEHDVFSPGTAEHRMVDIAGWQSTVQICMDIADPGPARAAAVVGAQLVLSPSTVSVDFLRKIHQARALENQVISVFCNRHGVEQDGTEYLGRSAVFLPDGTEISAGPAEDQLVLHTVGAEQLAEWSATQRTLIGHVLA
ncbi:carbon-nitrogen hydrolase family protein [Streptomyces sp. NPDC090045]|uniref:carbon-nitrogen hydrolase family protein n=1 Tax=Streptomyces sp. NPDC090045 TaxID=3365927 RepID=UPI00381ED008